MSHELAMHIINDTRAKLILVSGVDTWGGGLCDHVGFPKDILYLHINI